MRRAWHWFAALTLITGWAACSDDEERIDDDGGSGLASQTGESCVVPDDCYDDLADADIQGEVQCLDRVDGGYCTHLCTTNDDCCAVAGECDPGETQVCGPFESTGMMMCFISCENADISGDPEEHCQSYHADFICRSTGGGSNNKKVCVPSGNGPCGSVDDCNSDFPFCCENALGQLRCYDGGGSEGRTCLD